MPIPLWHPSSFFPASDEAAANLASLKFAQSNRGPDPRDPSRIVTTTTTTTFSMTREMAKAMCQHFMDARLIENASEPTSNLFKDRGTYCITPKGLHVLERFIAKNGISADHLSEVFQVQPICMKLLHLERRALDDEIIVSQTVIYTLFRRFAGATANFRPQGYEQLDSFGTYNERAKGIQFLDEAPKVGLGGLRAASPGKYCFQAVAGLEWLCDFTSVVGREEAAEMGAQFVRFGLITLVSDKRKANDSAIVFTVRGPTPGGDSPIRGQGDFRCTTKAVYKVTDEGIRVARWNEKQTPNGSTANVSRLSEDDRLSSDAASGVTAVETDPSVAKLARRMSVARIEGHDVGKNKESNSDRLRVIVEEPHLRNLFGDFLRHNFCEENLLYWVAVVDFRKKFVVTSSAVASNAPAAPTTRPGTKASPGQAAMERHHDLLIQQAHHIYKQFLASGAPQELNIDHSLRNELSGYLNQVVTSITGKPFSGRAELDHMSQFNATQLQMLITLFERIQTHCFRLMATDSVPKVSAAARLLVPRARLLTHAAVHQDAAVPVSAPPVRGRVRPLRPRGGARAAPRAPARARRERRGGRRRVHDREHARVGARAARAWGRRERKRDAALGVAGLPDPDVRGVSPRPVPILHPPFIRLLAVGSRCVVVAMAVTHVTLPPNHPPHLM
jgi:hypothetical protein